MKNKLVQKGLLIGFLMLILLFALSSIESLISERSHRRDSVARDIAGGTSSDQVIAGPVLTIPIRRHTVVDAAGDDGRLVRKKMVREETLYFFPDRLDVRGGLDTEIRRRGIFEALLYNSDFQLSGEFEIPANAGLDDLQGVEWLTPAIVVGLADNRGLRSTPQLTLNDEVHAFEPGQPVSQLGNGIHANVDLPVSKGGKFHFMIKLDLRGTQSLRWLPVGKETTVNLHSGWPHPSFGGKTLPTKHQITAQGFDANWQTSHFASNFPQRFLSAKSAEELASEASGLTLVTPVDVYQQAERSVKYGFLFVLLTFATFGLFEVLKRLPIHPVQYGLVGIALALFFLLLIALSEHFSFGWSYLAAAAACITLQGFYLSHVLRARLRGLAFCGWLTVLYGALYGLLVSEDNALLMGALLLFGILAAAMALTRKVDWYRLGQAETAEE
jgi:inner membrane protein